MVMSTFTSCAQCVFTMLLLGVINVDLQIFEGVNVNGVVSSQSNCRIFKQKNRIATLDASIVDFTRELSTSSNFHMTIEVKNTTTKSVVINKYIFLNSFRIYDVDGVVVPSKILSDVDLGPDVIDSYLLLKPGKSKKIQFEKDFFPRVIESKEKGVKLFCWFDETSLKPGLYSLDYEHICNDELTSVRKDGKSKPQRLSKLFPGHVCNVSFRTNPVIFHVK